MRTETATAKKHLAAFAQSRLFTLLHKGTEDQRIAGRSTLILAILSGWLSAIMFVVTLTLAFVTVNHPASWLIAGFIIGTYGIIIRCRMHDAAKQQEPYVKDLVCLQMAYGTDPARWTTDIRGVRDIEGLIDTAYSTILDEGVQAQTSDGIWLGILWRTEWLKDRFGFDLPMTQSALDLLTVKAH
jgi:hypothetical protein